MSSTNVPFSRVKTLSNTVVQPLFCARQLEGNDFRYLIGCGAIGSYISSLLPESARSRVTFVDFLERTSFEGRPAIGFREFLARSTPEDSVICTSDDAPVLPTLVLSGQRNVLAASHFARSYYCSAMRPAEGTSRLGVISTAPRCGTHRIMYFWYALNEILRNPRQIPSAHKLHLYYRSDSRKPDSFYYLSHVHDFMAIDDLQCGHFVPPGSLASLSANSALSQMHSDRWHSYGEQLVAHPELAQMSYADVGQVEPQMSYGRRFHTRYAFVVRDIFDQIVSVMSVYETMRRSLQRSGAAGWSLSEYISNVDSQPFGLFCNLDWQLPLLLRMAITEDKCIAEIIVREGHLRSLVRDYTWQKYSAHFFAACRSSSVGVRIFSYEDMIQDEPGFFQNLGSLIRGGPLVVVQQERIEQARYLTSGNRRIEESLGHSLSYTDLVSNPIRKESHMTNVGAESFGRQLCRSSVLSVINSHREEIQQTFQDLWTSLKNSEPGVLI